jgi:rhodanese-related sulfurtransferase
MDVRSPAEFAFSHLPGALNAESKAEIAALVKIIPTNRVVVLYCSVGVRSSKAANALLAAGRTHVFNLQGSIFQWANEGRSVVRDGRPVSEVHPYNEHWGRLLAPSHHPKSPP